MKLDYLIRLGTSIVRNSLLEMHCDAAALTYVIKLLFKVLPSLQINGHS